MPQPGMVDIFEKKEELAPQNFDAAIAAGVVSIIFNYGYHYCPDDYKAVATIVQAILGTFFILSFRTYLKNFAAGKVIYWLNWVIVTCIMSYIATLMMPFTRQKYAPAGHVLSPLSAVLFLFYFFILIVGGYTYIRLGMALQKVNDDFIGMLEQLGKVFLYIEGPALLLSPVFAFLSAKKHLMDNNMVGSEMLRIFGITIFMIPAVMQIIIFVKAKKYQENRLS